MSLVFKLRRFKLHFMVMGLKKLNLNYVLHIIIILYLKVLRKLKERAGICVASCLFWFLFLFFIFV